VQLDHRVEEVLWPSQKVKVQLVLELAQALYSIGDSLISLVILALSFMELLTQQQRELLKLDLQE
jgi:hypothetical protein